MTKETITQFKEKKGKRILKIYQDENAESPRHSDNIGKMVCFHKKYSLGDNLGLNKDNFDSWNALKGWLILSKNALIILPLYLYDHSGLRIKVGSFNGLLSQGHAEFDSGQVGFIYVDKETLIKEKLVGKGKKAENILRAEVETYDKYLSGQVYGYELVKEKTCKECSHIENEIIDSCWGYIENYSEFVDRIFKELKLDKKKFVEIKQ